MMNIRQMYDSLTNLVSGLGSSRDKAMAGVHTFMPRPQQELEAAYRGNWVARKAIDIPPNDEIKNGRDWQTDDKNIQFLEDEERRIGFWSKLRRARILARLHGGSAIYIGVPAGNLEQPLRVEEIKKEGLLYLHVLTRYELSVTGEIDRDITSEYYGQPELWNISHRGGNLRIHPSRIIRFIGNEVPDLANSPEPYWGDSVLDAILDALDRLEASHQGVAALIQEAKIDIFKIPGLSENLADEEYTSRLQRRFGNANMLKSIVGATVMDTEEEHEQKQVNFGTLPQIMQEFLQSVAGAADIPATRLLGQSPAGMNATGESDYRNYLDRISAGQRLDLTPTISTLDEVIIRSSLGDRPKDIHYTWAPCWQMSEKELADIGKIKAETTKIYVDTAMVPTDALATAVCNQLVEDGQYPGLDKALKESEFEPGEDERTPEEIEQERQLATSPAVEDSYKALLKDATPRTLYVRRDVLNKDEIVRWARAQGIDGDYVEDLHVTLCCSRVPIDWMKVDSDWNETKDGKYMKSPGGARMMERFGDKIVLMFSDWRLSYRHGAFIRAGASHDYPDYQPHVTISYGASKPIDEIEPYVGKIEFGPEIFEEVKT